MLPLCEPARAPATALGAYSRILLVVALTAACGSSSETIIGPTPPSRTLRPGETIPLDETVRILTGGDYLLPAGATRLTTRCTGSVTVMFSTGPGKMESNTCESADGTANQTNIVTGATQVTFRLGLGALADVTVTL